MSVGAVAHKDVMRSIELFGTEVAPVVRAEVGRREATAAENPVGSLTASGAAHPWCATRMRVALFSTCLVDASSPTPAGRP